MGGVPTISAKHSARTERETATCFARRSTVQGSGGEPWSAPRALPTMGSVRAASQPLWADGRVSR